MIKHIRDVVDRVMEGIESGTGLDGLPDINHYCFPCNKITSQGFLGGDYKLSDDVFIVNREDFCVVDYKCGNCGGVHTYVYDFKENKVL